jgi:hypothetical protein
VVSVGAAAAVGAVPVITLCSSFEDRVAIRTANVVTKTEVFVEEHRTRRDPLHTVVTTLVVGTWCFIVIDG